MTHTLNLTQLRAYYAPDLHLSSLAGLRYSIEPHKPVAYYEQAYYEHDLVKCKIINFAITHTSDGNFLFVDTSSTAPQIENKVCKGM